MGGKVDGLRDRKGEEVWRFAEKGEGAKVFRRVGERMNRWGQELRVANMKEALFFSKDDNIPVLAECALRGVFQEW